MSPKFNGNASWVVFFVAAVVFVAAVAFMIWGNSCSQQPGDSKDQAEPAAKSEQVSSKSAAIELPEI